jgi:DNA-binding GntR family transcriptional regulator
MAASDADIMSALAALGGPRKKGAVVIAEEKPDGAQDILDAIKERDPEALSMALKAFVSDCMTEYDKDDEAPESER